VSVNVGYRIDVLVEGQIVIEVKAVEKVLPVHVAQVLAYLKLSGCPIGLILNFNTVRLADGVRRVLNSSQAQQTESAPARDSPPAPW
jgi:GxxExxY protein